MYAISRVLVGKGGTKYRNLALILGDLSGPGDSDLSLIVWHEMRYRADYPQTAFHNSNRPLVLIILP